MPGMGLALGAVAGLLVVVVVVLLAIGFSWRREQ